MTIYFSILIGIYCFWILWLYYHWQKIPLRTPLKGIDTSNLFFSIIIPVRNEAKNILNLLNDIAQQNFPVQQFEVIIVDDASTDGTPDLIGSSDYLYKLSLFTLKAPENFSGSHKKLAITQAISTTSIKPNVQHIILTTDGDCSTGDEWLQAYADVFVTQKPELVSGPVTFHQEKKLFEKLQTIEFSSLIGTGAASIQAGSPNMCNGANLAFTKSAFENVNGYDGNMHHPSGDDEFLMRKMFQHYPKKIKFLKDPRAIVYTYAQQNLQAFYWQRRRWSGKWKAHKNRNAMVLAIFIFLFHLSLLLLFFLTILGLYDWKMFLFQIGIKFLCELLLISAVMRFLRKAVHIGLFLLVQFIYPGYVIYFGLAAHHGHYRWKGRKYQ